MKNVMKKSFGSVVMHVKNFGGMIKRKTAGESHLLAVIIMMAIVIVIGLIFKDQLAGLVNTMFGSFTTKATGIL